MSKEEIIIRFSINSMYELLIELYEHPSYFVDNRYPDINKYCPIYSRYIENQLLAIVLPFQAAYKHGVVLGFKLAQHEVTMYDREKPFWQKLRLLNEVDLNLHVANRIDLLGSELPENPLSLITSISIDKLKDLINILTRSDIHFMDYLETYLLIKGDTVQNRSYLYQGIIDGALPIMSLLEAQNMKIPWNRI